MQLKEQAMTSFFLDMLSGRPDVEVPELKQADSNSIACNVFSLVQEGNAASCAEVYTQLCRRVPDTETNWIYNDYLIFSLVCAVKKFKLDSGWLRGVINLRNSSSGSERQLLNTTLSNLLAGNLTSNEDLHEVSIVYQSLTGDMERNEMRINKMYKHLWRSPFPFFASDFLNLVALRAIEIAFESKGLLDPEKVFAIENFTTRFFRRTSHLASVAATLLVGIAGLVIGAVTLHYSQNVYVSGVTSLASAFGIGYLSVLVGTRQKVTAYLTKWVRRALGYSAL